MQNGGKGANHFFTTFPDRCQIREAEIGTLDASTIAAILRSMERLTGVLFVNAIAALKAAIASFCWLDFESKWPRVR
jgi:hypothetical protein